MRIAVIGTGMVGQALAGRLDELGHDVTVGTRDVDASLARTEATGSDGAPFGSLGVGTSGGPWWPPSPRPPWTRRSSSTLSPATCAWPRSSRSGRPASTARS